MLMWIGYIVIGAVMGVVAVSLYLVMADEKARECPHCGATYRAHLWGELWTCRRCRSPYRLVAGGKERWVSQELDRLNAVALAGIVEQTLSGLPVRDAALLHGMSVEPMAPHQIQDGEALILLGDWAAETLSKHGGDQS